MNSTPLLSPSISRDFGVPRRMALSGAGWSLPAVALAVSAPARAASPGIPAYQIGHNNPRKGDTKPGSDFDIQYYLLGEEGFAADGALFTFALDSTSTAPVRLHQRQAVSAPDDSGFPVAVLRGTIDREAVPLRQKVAILVTATHRGHTYSDVYSFSVTAR